jgi:hypothetical protein
LRDFKNRLLDLLGQYHLKSNTVPLLKRSVARMPNSYSYACYKSYQKKGNTFVSPFLNLKYEKKLTISQLAIVFAIDKINNQTNQHPNECNEKCLSV